MKAATLRARRAYVRNMYRGCEDVIENAPEADLFLVATAHCLSAGDYDRAIDFAAALARDRNRGVDAEVIPFSPAADAQTSSDASNRSSTRRPARVARRDAASRVT